MDDRPHPPLSASLGDELDRIRDDPERPEEVRAAVDATIGELRRAGVGDHAPRPGDPFPDFLLPDAEGRLVDLADLTRDGPFALTFFRGPWCPFCSATLRAAVRALPAIRAAGAHLVAVTPETGGRAVMPGAEPPIEGLRVLTDVDHGLAMACGVAFRTPQPYRDLLTRFGLDLAERQGNAGWFIPVPAAFVVDHDGVTRWSHVDPDFTRRAEPAAIVAALRALRPA
ncbi:peroxiredoxin-like family protein [Roseomonas sp. CCTCC AB2023176]|uniref:peroxiredoxin-like family protein n=1 Tax=Roseomonas sp. CCTCC AB2023176 TaxID=3342640 RepID=UPI0035D8B17E